MTLESLTWAGCCEAGSLAYFRLSEDAGDGLAVVGNGERALAGRVDHGVERQTQGVGDGGAEVGDADLVLADLDALVRLAVHLAAGDAAAPQHAAEGLRIMVAAGVLIDL